MPANRNPDPDTKVAPLATPPNDPHLPSKVERTGAEGAPHAEPNSPPKVIERTPGTEGPPNPELGQKSPSDTDVGLPQKEALRPKDLTEKTFLVEDAKAGQAPVYMVAEGKMVTTLRGPMGAFQEVYPRDFTHGQAAIDELVGLQSIIKKS